MGSVVVVYSLCVAILSRESTHTKIVGYGKNNHTFSEVILLIGIPYSMIVFEFWIFLLLEFCFYDCSQRKEIALKIIVFDRMIMIA